MKKNNSVLYYGLLCICSITIFGGNIVFGEDCRNMKVDTTDVYHQGHVYTCEFNDTNTKTRLQKYCTKDNTISTEPGYSCPAIAGSTQLYCHICKCESGKRKDGKCESVTNSVNQTTESPQKEEQTTNTSAILSENKTLQNGEQTTSQETKSEDTCSSKIFDSQGKCCKKTYYDLTLKATVCCEGILLSTNVPFIGQCIVFKKSGENQDFNGTVVNEQTAFPVLMGGLSKILISVILLVCFIGILIGGVMIASSGGSDEGSKKGKKIIGNIISALALLGASGVILKLINPNFFG